MKATHTRLLTMPLLSAPLLAIPALLAGCHSTPSRGIAQAPFTITVRNQGPDVHQLEVDYPNASFGRDLLPSGASFQYPPKLMGSGPVKVAFVDSMGKNHSATGPTVQEGLRKDMVIAIGEDETVLFQDMTEKTR